MASPPGNTTEHADARARLHRRATEIFTHAVKRPPEERPRYIDRACGDDDALRAEIHALLAHDHDTEIAANKSSRRILDALARLLAPGTDRRH